jgi:hypothetical protein
MDITFDCSAPSRLTQFRRKVAGRPTVRRSARPPSPIPTRLAVTPSLDCRQNPSGLGESEAVQVGQTNRGRASRHEARDCLRSCSDR